MAIDFSKSEEFVNPLEDRNLLEKALKYGIGGYATAKLGKRFIGRHIDTHGFGGNVSGSYESTGKITQALDNLLTAGKGNTFRMPIEALKQLRTMDRGLMGNLLLAKPEAQQLLNKQITNLLFLINY